MNIILRAAMVAVSLGTISPAYAGEGEGGVADTRATEVPGVVAQAPTQSRPLLETTQNGQVSRSNGTTWVFPPIGKYLAQ
jgi:hypothetical protein